jgi:hypothetical protein
LASFIAFGAGLAAYESLTSQCARQVTLQGTTDIHVDDEVLSASAGRTASIRVEAGALELLT